MITSIINKNKGRKERRREVGEGRGEERREEKERRGEEKSGEGLSRSRRENQAPRKKKSTSNS